ncbi:MAG TPA: cytochrome P450 [Pirellulales bacterium]|jgi:cytochrome P450|nr:cytochrome P450 [Pirellulales bacterium]
MQIVEARHGLRPFNPPGPKGRPVVGNLIEFRRDKLAFFTRCAREFGDLARFHIGSRAVVLLSDPAMIEQVLATQQRNFVKHFVLSLLRPVLGEGLITSDGEFWLRQRRLIQPAFQRSLIETYAGTMVSLTERMLAEWQSGDERDLHAEMMHLTLEITAKALLDADVSGSEFQSVADALEVLMRDFVYRFEGIVKFPLWMPTLWNWRVKHQIRKLDRVIYGIIDRRRRGPLDGADLLTGLMQARDAGTEQPGARGAMTDRQLRDEVMTLFLAGHETTANAMTWTGLLLAQHPEVEARLQAELQTVLNGRSPTAADVPRLAYTEQVITESMRVYPPVYAVGRRSIRPCEIGGFDVPEGTTFLMSQWVLHHDSRYFDSPLEFRPERWADGLAKRIPKFAYFPFGGGPRLCVGNSFAMLEAVLILATMAQRFRFELVPGQRIVPWATVTLRPKHGIHVVCRQVGSAKPSLAPGEPQPK